MHDLGLAIGFGLVTASVIALAAVGITLQYGVTTYINFAYGAYFTLGAFIAWSVNVGLHTSVWLAVFVGAAGITGFAVVTNRVLLSPFVRKHPPRMTLLIVTLGLWLILDNAIVVIWGPDTRQFNVSGETPIAIGPFLLTSAELLIIATSGVMLLGLHLLLTRTTLGKAMRATADDSDLAQVSGINIERIVDATWLITGFLVGLAGCVLALNLSSFQSSFGDDYVFVIFSAVIVGGIGQPYGTMLGALIIGLATEVSAVFVNSAFKSDIAFALLIVMLLLRPQGLIPAKGRS